jgi:hypothetical protein
MDCVAYETAKKFRSQGYEKVIYFSFTDGQPCHRYFSKASRDAIKISYYEDDGEKIDDLGLLHHTSQCSTKILLNGQSFDFKMDFKKEKPLKKDNWMMHDISLHCKLLEIMENQLGVETVTFIQDERPLCEHLAVIKYYMKCLMKDKDMEEIKKILNDPKHRNLFYSKKYKFIANTGRMNSQILPFYEKVPKSFIIKRNKNDKVPDNLWGKPAEIFYYLKFEFKKINKLVGNAIGELMA